MKKAYKLPRGRNMYTEEKFLDFLIKAKKATYASQGDNASVTPLLEGSRQLEFQEGHFLYRDIYFGMSYFACQEIVYYQGIRFGLCAIQAV
jgi:hypothetical protein